MDNIHSPPKRQSAVAVRGDCGASGTSATVVAKGEGALAEAILAAAFAHGVRVRVDAGLTAALAVLDLDSPIPTPALEAVASVLARVYAEDQRCQQRRPEHASNA